jgi:hypothetical protein
VLVSTRMAQSIWLNRQDELLLLTKQAIVLVPDEGYRKSLPALCLDFESRVINGEWKSCCDNLHCRLRNDFLAGSFLKEFSKTLDTIKFRAAIWLPRETLSDSREASARQNVRSSLSFFSNSNLE